MSTTANSTLSAHRVLNHFRIPEIFDDIDHRIGSFTMFHGLDNLKNFTFSLFEVTTRMELSEVKDEISKIGGQVNFYDLCRQFALDPSILKEGCTLIALGTRFEERLLHDYKVWYPCITFKTSGNVGFELGLIAISDDVPIPSHYHILVKTKK